MRLRTPCARKAPTEACVKQHLGAVAETGEEGARLLPPQPFWPPCTPSGNAGSKSAGISTRCLLTRHPFRLSTLPGDFVHCGQAIGAFAREQGRFCILRQKAMLEEHCPKAGNSLCLRSAKRPPREFHAEIAPAGVYWRSPTHAQ